LRRFLNPSVSIVMPVWNGEKYLAASLQSVWAQTFTDFELIVVDDGSTDATAKILSECLDPRLRVCRLPHGGIVQALNHGLQQARAGWIARLDADDLALPERLARQWRALQKNPAAVLCHTGVEFINEAGLPVCRLRMPRSRSLLAMRLCFQCPIVHSTVMFKQAVAVAVGGYLPADRHAEDYSLWGRMLCRGEFIGLPEKLVRFRVHPYSVSRQNQEFQQVLAKKIGVAHCRQFMRLSAADAVRANAILAALPAQRGRREWGWFLARCAPRLRWKSLEVIAWWVVQTLRTCIKR
jgi:glycosyltransferase involved in cell wall biosynthesis